MSRSMSGAALAVLVLSASLMSASIAQATPTDTSPDFQVSSSPNVGALTMRAGQGQCDLGAGRTTLTVTSDGVDRTAVVSVPTNKSSARNRVKGSPLVLDLHGSNSTPTEQLSRSGLDRTGEREGFIVAAPQGAIPAPAGAVWNVPYTATDVPGAPNDEVFLQDLIDNLVDRGCVDSSRVYAAGYSGGGRMISQLACDNPDLFSAIAPVAGLRAGAPVTTSAGVTPDPATCAPSRAVPVITFNGTTDPVNPFTGGGAPYWGYGAIAASDRWAEINGCRTTKTTNVTQSVSLTTHQGCSKNAVVQQYVIDGGGHTWPGADPATFPGAGPTTQEIDANQLIWDFFKNRSTRP